ncbi:MAG: T9SS type B sorting domain-containing protein, partial [Bacteroidetes bacterium]|nr:T9SS type B sorting domain-containing protein [Bacteroidota bacterium]
PQTIWIRINNDSAPLNCSSIDSFSLSVTESAAVNLAPDPIYACDDNNDGFFNNFDLTQRDDAISLGNPDIAVSYHPTQSDAENNLNPLQSPYANVVENQQTIYIRAEDTTNGCFNTGELELIVVDSPLLETPEPLVGCDVNETGILAFDLTQVEDEVLDGIDPTTVSISYHTSQADAQDNINPIAIPSGYNNANNPQTVYIRVEDPNSPLNCFNIETIELQVEPLPDISDPTILEKCDDPTGSGLFDEVASFDLTQKIPEITNANEDLSVTFYATEADQSNDNPIDDPENFVNTENPQTIEVSVSSSETPCVTTTTLTVSVDPLPTIPDPEPLQVCDVDNDGFAEFDLEAEVNNILDGEIETDISFHLTEAEAQVGTNEIDTSSNFSNTNPDNQTIYVRAEKSTTGCFDVKPLELIITPSPEIDNLQDLSQCDDGDNNGFAPFDLTQNTSAAIGGQDDTDLNITYHLSQSDAQDNINPIAVPSNFINSINPQTIYVRLENTETGCFDTFSGTQDTTNSFTISVEPQPQIFEPSPLAVCDDDDNQDPFPQVAFNLTQKESEMIGQPNVPDNLSFSYYESQADLDNNNPITSPEDFTNTLAPPQTIIVEVSDTATENNCTSTTTLSIDVLPLPSPSETDADALRLTQCDDDRDGVAALPFDLSLSGQLIGESENVDISYYTSENEAEAGEDQGRITNPQAYVNEPALNIDDADGNPTNIQIIYTRVESGVQGNDCFVIVPFELQVEPNPVLHPQGNPFGYTLCEDGDTGRAEILSFVDVTNNLYDQSSGDASTIIPLLDPDVLPEQNLEDYTISYHNSAADADTNTNPLSSGYQATDGEILYIRVEHNETGCYNINNIGEVIINIQPRPAIASSVADMEVCANEIGNDQVATMDLTQRDADINPGQADGVEVEVIYYEGMMNFNEATPIADPQNYTTNQSPQTIIAEIVNTETNCESADTVSFEIDVNSIPEATIAPYDGSILCFDSNGNIIETDFSPPVLDSGLEEAPNLTFEWSLDGNPLDEDGSSITALQRGTYSLTVTDNSSPANCSTTSTAQVIQSSPPQFTAEVTTEVFAENHQILVSNITGIGDYEFRLDNGPWRDLPAGQSSMVFTNVSGGSHQVTGRDKNGCGEFIVNVETLSYPDFFTPNEDGYNDRWNINGLSNRDNVKIYIFDRYGKLIKQLSPNGPGWDGTFNGKKMPSNDYWFNLEYQVQTDSTTTMRTLKDNFTLKR